MVVNLTNQRLFTANKAIMPWLDSTKTMFHNWYVLLLLLIVNWYGWLYFPFQTFISSYFYSYSSWPRNFATFKIMNLINHTWYGVIENSSFTGQEKKRTFATIIKLIIMTKFLIQQTALPCQHSLSFNFLRDYTDKTKKEPHKDITRRIKPNSGSIFRD